MRNRQVFCRGEKSKGGNLNLRFVEKNDKLQLRINIGKREWIYVPAYVAEHEERLLERDEPYGVRIIREEGEYKLRVNIEEEYEVSTDYEKGVVGLDFNHSTIDLAVTNSQGQLKDTRTIDCHNLTSSKEGKREWLIGNLAKEVVDYAKYWERGIVIEGLSDLTRRKSNSHKFTHKKFLEAVKRKAKKEGVEVDDVNPAFTSVIGKRKYSSYYHITVHQSAALVIARRGQGFSEHLRGLKTLLFGPSEGEEEKERVPDHRVHSWSLWRLMRDPPSRKGMNRKHSCQLAGTTAVESTRTIGSAERCSCPAEDGPAGRETDIPGDGPPETGVKRTQLEPISPLGREAKKWKLPYTVSYRLLRFLVPG